MNFKSCNTLLSRVITLMSPIIFLNYSDQKRHYITLRGVKIWISRCVYCLNYLRDEWINEHNIKSTHWIKIVKLNNLLNSYSQAQTLLHPPFLHTPAVQLEPREFIFSKLNITSPSPFLVYFIPGVPMSFFKKMSANSANYS